MPYLVAAVVAVAAVTLLNLLLLLALLRRLRTGALETTATVTPGRGLLLGSAAAPFRARLLDGAELTDADLTGEPTLIGFFSPGCRACAEQTPHFLRRAASWPGGPGRVVAVIAGDGEEGARYAATFAEVARLVVDGQSGPVATAYGVSAFPAFGVLDPDGTVVAESVGMDHLPRPSSQQPVGA
jgi:thiol-disulfide isomerase/thioredoxin